METTPDKRAHKKGLRYGRLDGEYKLVPVSYGKIIRWLGIIGNSGRRFHDTGNFDWKRTTAIEVHIVPAIGVTSKGGVGSILAIRVAVIGLVWKGRGHAIVSHKFIYIITLQESGERIIKFI